MTNVLSYTLLALTLLLPSFAQSEETASGEKASAETSSEAKPANSATSQTPAASQTEAPPASSTNGAAPAAPAAEGDKSQQQPAAEPAKAPDSAASEALKASKEEEEKKKQKAVTEVVPQEGGVIAGKFELDVIESYTHLTSNQLYIEGFGILPIVVVGDVSVQSVRRDIFSTTVSANYKLTDRMQVSLSIPYQQTIARVSTANGISGKTVISANDEKVSQSSDLGDVSGSLNYQLMTERVGRPSLYGGLSIKARNGRDVFETPDPAAKPPPGSGFYSLRGSVSASKSSAPAVIFGSFAYAYNFERKNIVYTAKAQNPVLIKTYQPGQNFSLSAGVSLSLNYDLALNFSFAQSFSYTSRINGNVLANSATNAITFRMGGIWRVSDKTSIDMSVTMGLSPDAPGYNFAVRVPWRF